MESKTQKAVIIHEYGKKLDLKEDYPIPPLKDGELLIKVHASSVHPADRMIIQGIFFRRPLPALCGMEGTGIVVDSKGEGLQGWVGKRVSFLSNNGSWCQFAVSTPDLTFEIDQDVPMCSASSGVGNPLTVIGLIETFRQSGCKGIIVTAGASSIGKMLVRLCFKENIPLLSLVRKQDQAYDLKKQGALNVIVTKGEWEIDLKDQIKKYGFDCFFDALGGGPVTETVINSLGQKGRYYLFAGLQRKPFHLQNPFALQHIVITGFSVFQWWAHANEQTKKRIRGQYSSLLKNELRTKTFKEVTLKNIEQAVELSSSKANEGKILVRID